MKVFIFGNNGNMGRRYAAVLRYLGHEACGSDVGSAPMEDEDLAQADAYIIATPTRTHLGLIRELLDCGRPVLCEKPIVATPDLSKLEELLAAAWAHNMQLSMVSQYDYLVDPERTGDTLYDFYRSGGDGIAWDCINIIWHAKGDILLRNESPIWKCKINGENLEPHEMDFAYIAMIRNWLDNPYEPQYDRILKSHQKVVDYLDARIA